MKTAPQVSGRKGRGNFRGGRSYLSLLMYVMNNYNFIGYDFGNQDLYLFLQKAGYVLMFKPTILDDDGNVKVNIDTDLVLQAMIDYHKYDKAVIVSSDGDFYSLVNYLYKKNKLEYVISPYKATCSSLLKKSAKEKIVFIDNLQKKLRFRKS